MERLPPIQSMKLVSIDTPQKRISLERNITGQVYTLSVNTKIPNKMPVNWSQQHIKRYNESFGVILDN